ncbi:hypothetical protein FRC04_004882, partial [Tulasnella sp. 424]
HVDDSGVIRNSCASHCDYVRYISISALSVFTSEKTHDSCVNHQPRYVSVLICGSDPSIHHAINADERLLATDIAITGLTLWKLGGRSGQAGIPKTESALRRLRNVTVEAAVPPAICAVINMITYLTLENLVHNWFAVMTARFYVWSLMFTLNS